MHARGSRYVGFTGLTILADVGCLSSLREPSTGRGPRWMAGILASGKTMRGDAGGSLRYPSIAMAADLVAAVESIAWPVLHYNTRLPDPLDEQIDELLRRVPGARGVQLNMATPNLHALRRLRERVGSPEIILQVRRDCLADLEHDTVDRYVRSYEGAVDHALLDLSCGSGNPLDVGWASTCIRRHGAAWLAAGIRPTFAGGLGPDSEVTFMMMRAALGALSEECSCDAETNLRMADGDAFDPERVAGYERAYRLFVGDAVPTATLAEGDSVHEVFYYDPNAARLQQHPHAAEPRCPSLACEDIFLRSLL